MEMRVGNGREEAVAPIDPSTGQPMTATAWRAYMAQFMQEIRAALPNTEIVHNAIWYSDEDAGTSEASIRNEISASNYVYLERGVNDSGLTGGNGQWSLNALLSFIDQVHALGRGVVLDGTASGTPAMEYNLASYFLVSTGNDAVSGPGQTPENWWAGWNVNLGEAAGPRYTWNNLLRRDFTGGTVLVNPPDEPTQTVTLPTPMKTVGGNTVTSVTLPAGSGAILVGTSPSITRPQPTTPAPTETTAETKPVVSSPSPPSTGGSSGMENSSSSSNRSSNSKSSTSTSSTTTRWTPTQSTPPKHEIRQAHQPAACPAGGEDRSSRATSASSPPPRRASQIKDAELKPVTVRSPSDPARAHRVLCAGTEWR